MFVIKCLLFIKIIQGLEVYQGGVVGYPTICLPSPPAFWGLIFAPIRISRRKDSIQATSLIDIKSKTMIIREGSIEGLPIWAVWTVRP